MSQGITIKQERAVLALIETGSVEGASKKAKIAKNTIYKYLNDPEFSSYLSSRRDQVFNEAIEKLKSLTMKAVERLTTLLDSDDETVKRLTAKIVLDSAFRGNESLDIEKRLSAIEEIVRTRFLS